MYKSLVKFAAFLISGTLLVCTSSLLFTLAPQLVITDVESFFILVSHQLWTHPIETAFLLTGCYFLFRAFKEYRKVA